MIIYFFFKDINLVFTSAVSEPQPLSGRICLCYSRYLNLPLTHYPFPLSRSIPSHVPRSCSLPFLSHFPFSSTPLRPQSPGPSLTRSPILPLLLFPLFPLLPTPPRPISRALTLPFRTHSPTHLPPPISLLPHSTAPPLSRPPLPRFSTPLSPLFRSPTPPLPNSLQWRSEGNWRPGAKLNFAPPLKKFLKNDIKMSIVFN